MAGDIYSAETWNSSFGDFSPDLADSLSIPVGSVRYRIAKRALDIFLAILLLPVILPVLLILAVFIKFTSPGPIFYRQTRIGQYGRPFRLWKLRTMWTNSETMLALYLSQNPEAATQWNRQYKLRNDPRVTPFGHFLRRTSLDEIPQLFNVLRGEMSFVGPRPVIDAEMSRYGGGLKLCLSAKPGLTGLWQVRGRGRVQYEVRVSLDLEYVSTWSLGRDLILILKTFPAVWSAEGAF